MISTLLIIAGTLMVAAAAMTIIGMTVSDVRAIRTEAMFNKHPRLQRYRRRPLVSVIVDGDTSDRCIEGIRQNTYRKIEIINLGEKPRGSLLLRIQQDVSLDKSAVSDAVHQLNMDPSRQSIELIPAYIKPVTLRDLLSVYRIVTLAPFIAVRSLFHVTHSLSTWHVLTRRDESGHSVGMYVYVMFRWLVQLANAFVLIFAIYLAIIPQETFYLEIYLSAFGFWLLLSIMTYPRFSFGQKIKYALLAPVSLSYFLLLAFMAPISPLVRLWRIRPSPRPLSARW